MIVDLTSLTNTRHATLGILRITFHRHTAVVSPLRSRLLVVMAVPIARMSSRCSFLRSFRGLSDRVRVMMRVKQNMKARTNARQQRIVRR